LDDPPVSQHGINPRLPLNEGGTALSLAGSISFRFTPAKVAP